MLTHAVHSSERWCFLHCARAAPEPSLLLSLSLSSCPDTLHVAVNWQLVHILLRPLPVAVSVAYFLANSCFILYIYFFFCPLLLQQPQHLACIFIANCLWKAASVAAAAAIEKHQRLAVLSSGNCFLGCFALIATLHRLWVIYESSLAVATLANINTNTITTHTHIDTHTLSAGVLGQVLEIYNTNPLAKQEIKSF